MNVTISRALKKDIARITELSQRTYIEAFSDCLTKKDLENGLQTRTLDFYRQVFNKDEILLAEINGQLVGYIQFGGPTFEIPDVKAENKELQRVYVLAEYQNRGIGKALIEAAMESPTLKSAGSIYLEVFKNNHAAQKLYRTFGFREIAKTNKHVIMVRKSKF